MTEDGDVIRTECIESENPPQQFRPPRADEAEQPEDFPRADLDDTGYRIPDTG